MKVLAAILIVLGILGLGYGGITWTQRERVVDIGGLKIDADKEKSLPIPPIAGAICLVAGIVILVSNKRRA